MMRSRLSGSLTAKLVRRDLCVAAGVAIALLTAGCGSTLTIAPKPVSAQVVAFDENAQNAGVIDCDARGCLVTPGWMKRYGAMEKEFRRSVAGDSSIKSEGENYRVSYEVTNHYAEMRAAQRGP